MIIHVLVHLVLLVKIVKLISMNVQVVHVSMDRALIVLVHTIAVAPVAGPAKTATRKLICATQTRTLAIRIMLTACIGGRVCQIASVCQGTTAMMVAHTASRLMNAVHFRA